ncbi:Fanconi anemia group M protein [Triplophysa tibetana]|uniref:Fanconi anemia group M protein n=1 Tax=Triplophysa tibetana TaxID=1572043 RepID=A0A5A9NTL0_9TELE|nr:Fanconi anemia group M protein [Triplophysa tibetana]
MGLRSLFLFIQNIISGAKESPRMRNELQRNPVFMDLYRDMEVAFKKPNTDSKEPYVYSHPKLQRLDEVVSQHFKTSGSDSSDGANTRVMIFSSFRESVQEIADMLNRHQPLVRVMTFMGQSSAGKGVRGFTQKEQLEVVRRFRDGGFNTLVSTCVGEEGLDIGEVDLIVCFDAQKSPIRLVQRMGRTGRRRQGRIVIILAEGREERTYNQSQSSRRSINKSIMGNKHSFHMFPRSPRMLPVGVTPTLHKMHISCAPFQHTEEKRRNSGKGRRSSLNAQSGGSDVKRLKEDGCLTAAEEAVWMSTMRLEEDEPQPVFGQTSLLSFSRGQPAQEVCVSGRVRELSLWEWRHWQNTPQPTYRVEHSERCLHFTSIMEEIDRMRQEEQGDCGDVFQLMMKDDDEDGGTTKPPRMRSECDQYIRPSSSTPYTHQTCKPDEREKTRRSGTVIQRRSCDVPAMVNDSDAHHIITQSDENELRIPESNTSSHLTHMFHPSDFRSNTQRHAPPEKTLHLILTSVKELLSKSPPRDLDVLLSKLSIDLIENSPTRDLRPLTVKRDGEDSRDIQKSSQFAGNLLSPSWDEMFDDDPEKTDVPSVQQLHDQMDLNESVELFEDDEEFLRVSIPDVRTPGEKTSEITSEPQNVTAGQSYSKGPGQNSEVFNCSQDFFSVNFDLGLSFDSDEEATEEKTNTSALNKPKAPVVSPPSSLAGDVRIRCAQTALICEKRSSVAVRPSASTPNHEFPSASHRRTAHTSLEKHTSTDVPISDGEEEVFVRKPALKVNPLSSPQESKIFSDVDSPLQARRKHALDLESKIFSDEDSPLKARRKHALDLESKIFSDVDSPVQACRKRAAGLDVSEDTDVDGESDGDFHQGVTHRARVVRPRSAGNHLLKSSRGRQFLDEEAELSEDDEEFSSDEDDGDEQNHSLNGFVVNATQCSEGLNESEMQAIYLKSVRSPAVQKRIRMTYKPKHNVDIFSQVPEQDETYAEDSFVLHGSDVEEASDEEPVDVILEDSYIDGRKQYATRRRAQIKQIRAAHETSGVQSETGRRNKRSRIIPVQDSSEEEEETGFKVPQCVSTVPEKRVRQTDRQPETFSHLMDEQNETLAVTRRAPVADAPIGVLVDSRCISGGSEVVSSLRLRHGLKVHVCSLLSSDFIVSNRMAVEWMRESDVASTQNRRRLQERIQRVQTLHERVCLIIERDRSKPGETYRAVQRSRFYDGTLAALVRAGVRLMVSGGPDETALILTELAQVEKRKGQAIAVALEVRGHRQQALQFFLTLPHVSYITALNMCHNFPSVGHVINSPVSHSLPVSLPHNHHTVNK